MSSTSNLQIIAYKDTKSNTAQIGNFILQLNPISITVVRSTDNNKKATKDDGSPAKSKSETFQPAKYTFKFTLDDSGAVSSLKLPKSNISECIQNLEKLTVKPNDDTHQNPYVYLYWGDTFKDAYYGQVSSLKYNYTYFDFKGNPLRAEVNLTVTEINAEFKNSRTHRSPDITKMPLVRDKDNIIKFSIDSYDDKKFYIKIAEINNLSSVRALKQGSQIFLPPIKK